MEAGTSSPDVREQLRAEEEHRRRVFAGDYEFKPPRAAVPPGRPTATEAAVGRGNAWGSGVAALARVLLEEMRQHQELCTGQVWKKGWMMGKKGMDDGSRHTQKLFTRLDPLQLVQHSPNI